MFYKINKLTLLQSLALSSCFNNSWWGESDKYRSEACLHHTSAKQPAAPLTHSLLSFLPRLLHLLTLRSLLSFSAN
ncbi:hypothetical protein OIU84_016839 [Salix udensis]|uniref:Lipoprotein n=1 Tax=Salix udensis TaxID=889485 RepID=A0AAD6NQ88_9ROSI|nr:hypothetical protein OIU84_016839 [Salix udensis]